MRIVIAGGAGFVGANLAVDLSGRGHDVISADNLRRRGSELSLPRLSKAGVRFEHADARCPEDWRFLREFDPEAILDCAAQPSAIDGYANPTADFTINTMPLLHLLEHCRVAGCGLILWSTNKVYGESAVGDFVGLLERLPTRWEGRRPIDESCPLDGGDRSLYGASKVMGDLMVQEWAGAFNFPAVVNRCSCLAGPWQWGKAEQGWVSWWMIAHHLGLELQYIGYEGRQVRDVLGIDDLASLISDQLADLRPGPEVFNVGGGPEATLSLRECTALCQKITGKQVPVVEVATPRRADFAWYASDITKVHERYGWLPRSMPEKTLRTIDVWVRGNLEALSGLVGLQRAEEAAA